jgi:signal transduction histidine kinase
MRIRIQDGHWVEGDDIVHLYRTIAHILGAVYGENEQGDWVQVGEAVEPFRAWALEHLEELRRVDTQAAVHLYKALAAQQNDETAFIAEAAARGMDTKSLMAQVLQKHAETKVLMSAVEAVAVQARQAIQEAQDGEMIVRALVAMHRAMDRDVIDMLRTPSATTQVLQQLLRRMHEVSARDSDKTSTA